MFWRVITLGLMGTGLFFAGCSRQEAPAAPVVQAKPKPKRPIPPPSKDFQTPWQTESEYIVTMVAADLAEMAYFAKHGRALASDTLPVEVSEVPAQGRPGPVYRVVVRLAEEGEVACELPMTGAIWAPVTYQPLVRALFERFRLAGTQDGAGAPSALLSQLQELRVEVLTKVDGELSERLAADFTSAERHAEAALLLGAFTLRETDGLFFQIRAELCRMAAHLAFADGLRAGREPGVTGQLAEAALTVLCNNQAPALELLAAVPDSEEAAAWKRALRMRATHDFRIIGESRTRTLLEELEWFRARAEAVDLKWAWASLRLSDEQKMLADWPRVAAAATPNVGIGHVLLETGLPAEFREIGLAYEAEEGKPLSSEELVAALNAEPQRCVTATSEGRARVRIIGWGTWAAFLQRHLCQALVTNFLFMRDRWGVPDQAKQYQRAIDPQFWGLRLYPFVRRQCAPDHDYYKKAQDEEMELVRRSPQVVPAEAWNHICYEVAFGPVYWPPPHPFINEWHRPNPPPGTAYNPHPRMNHPSLTGTDTVPRLERMHRLAPYDLTIGYNLLRFRDGEKQTLAGVEQVFAAGLDYHTYTLNRLSRLAKDPAQREKWIRKAAALNPSEYLTLARFYIEQRREDDAAQAYVEWVSNEIDEVMVSNSAEWLIKYFERKGDLASARNLADRAATAYSAAGLLAKARLLERQREMDGAVEFYQKQAERYDDYGPLLGFLIRLKEAGSNEHAALLDSLLKEHLPTGLVKFDKAARAAPRIGVRVPEQGAGGLLPGSAIEAAGLRRGDIVVSVRGYRVADWNSFKVLRSLEPELPYVLTVWRENKYVELPPLAASYRFGVNLVDYRAP